MHNYNYPVPNSSTAGIRQLKAHLSAYLNQVKHGQAVTITERGHKIGIILPTEQKEEPPQWLWSLIKQSAIKWSGGKPKGLQKPVSIKGKPLSQTILENRN